MSFVTEYKGAFIFLILLFVLSLLLIILFVALKRGMCNCFSSNKGEDADDEDDVSLDEAKDFQPADSSEIKLDIGIDNFPLPADEPPPAPLPDVVVTESLFAPEYKPERKKSSQLKSIMKRVVKAPLKGVHFGATLAATEKTVFIETPETAYGSMEPPDEAALAPLRRSESMESFMSTVSSATTNCEEFGSEVSPGRLQLSVEYDPKRWTLTIAAKQADCLINIDKSVTMYWQVSMALLPFKKHRFKTRYKASSTPVFNQTFEVDNIPIQALSQLAVRYRVYGKPGRTGRKKLAGETRVELAKIDQLEDRRIKEWRELKRANIEEKKRQRDKMN